MGIWYRYYYRRICSMTYLSSWTGELQNFRTNPIIFMAPLPRYLEKGCCQDPDHMKNRLEPDFAKKLEEGVFAVRRNIKNSAFRHEYKHCVTLSAWGKVRKIESIWSDGVHLTNTGYKKLAEAVLEAREELKLQRKGDKLEEAPVSKKPRADASAAPAPTQRKI
jgi:lysophospholipase L1-like esterase